MKPGKGALLAPLMRFAAGLRFPWLFLLTLVLFLVDLVVPDLIPFADEILLGLLALLLGNIKRRDRRAERRTPSPSQGPG
jgi:Family of unknown function (DUF6116)